ncbi:response regulator [Persicobacter psychrovividus]|uniref:Response regulatory domain-containing protein n=1 Tax=Persicobacter psychrovividus TaxID=387638 RepID=A0ABN6LE72_9BACT|nr:hypothetical protein PEPS_37730 [Persicobacter psychrovividus]
MVKILVVEDEHHIRENLVDFLTFKKYQVAGAANGIEGLELYDSFKPDLVICDVMMPQMDGYEFLNVLRNEKKHHHIPFLFLTAKASRQDFREGMNAGADDFITKPFTFQEVEEAIESRMNQKIHRVNSLKAQLDDLRINLEKISDQGDDGTGTVGELKGQIEELNNVLGKKNQQIEDVSFIASHKVRAPLCNILGLLDLAKEEEIMLDDEFVDLIKHSARVLDESIHQLNDRIHHVVETINEGDLESIKSIFLIDDDPFQHKINARILSKNLTDIDIKTFLDPMDALQAFKVEAPDLMLLDINMPEMNGWQFLDHLLELPHPKKTRIFMLSSSIDTNDEKKAFRYDIVQGFINKPLSKAHIGKLFTKADIKA